MQRPSLGLQTLCFRLCFLSVPMLTVKYYYSALQIRCKFPVNKALSCTTKCVLLFFKRKKKDSKSKENNKDSDIKPLLQEKE